MCIQLDLLSIYKSKYKKLSAVTDALVMLFNISKTLYKVGFVVTVAV